MHDHAVTIVVAKARWHPTVRPFDGAADRRAAASEPRAELLPSPAELHATPRIPDLAHQLRGEISR